MAKRIVEGLWDCAYCGTKAIGGLTKHCPCCGHPQDEGTTFYLGTRKNYLESELAAEYGQGPDWVCPYCGSLNRIRFKYCAGCGAAKESAEDDYFTSKEKKKKQDSVSEALQNEQKQAPKKSTPKKRLPLVLALIALFFVTLLIVFWPRNYTGEVRATAWAREIDIEAYRTVQESDWTVPDGGRVYNQRSEIHHYRQVLDHYETRTRRVSEQVYDGEETHTSYTNNGDGTFSEETWTTPRYRTEYHTETYQEPIYRDEPVFATKYYYEIERWVTDREEKSEGADSTPYWPQYTLASNERTGFIGEAYTISIYVKDKRYSVSLPLEWWETFKSGDTVDITVSGGKVTKINGREVE